MIANETKVLIIGAGPSGMTAALALHRAGVKAMVIDRQAQTRQYSQAAVLWPRTLEVLDMLGIVEDWRDRSLPIEAFQANLDGHFFSLPMVINGNPFPQPWAVGQDVTEEILQRRLLEREIDLYRSVDAISVRLGDSGVDTVLRLSDNTELQVHSEWIVGCEGSKSIVREAAGIQREGSRNAEVQLVQGDVRIRGPLALESTRGYLFSLAERESMLVIPTSTDGHFRVLVTMPNNDEQDAPTLEYLNDRVQHFVPGMETYDPRWLNRFRTQHQLAGTFRHGRALIAGDTAHVWVPLGGQGMNIAMQDAFDLGWKLGGVVRGTLPEPILDTYTTERRPIGETTISYTEKAYRAILDPESRMSQIMRRLVPEFTKVEAIDKVIAKRLGQLDFCYPASTFVVNHSADGLKAGERAPEARVNMDGKTVRLFDLYRRGEWLVLMWVFDQSDLEHFSKLPTHPSVRFLAIDTTREGIIASGAAHSSGFEVVRDIAHLAAQAFEVSKPCIHVIRPDAVIGFRGGFRGALQFDNLRNYLAAALIS